MIVRVDDQRLLRAVRARLPRLQHLDRAPERRHAARSCCARTSTGDAAAAVGLGRRARARPRARPAPPQRPRLLGDVAARVRHAAARRRWPRPRRPRTSWPACPRRPTSTSPPASTAAPRRRAIRAATNVPGVIASRLSGLRHHDLHRDVGARRAHRRDQPRPGLPGRGRARGGARGRAGGDPRRPQPVRAAARACPRCAQAIAEHQQRFYGIELDPASEVQVTMGATEAITAAVLGLCEPGDEVLAFDPTYDSYARGGDDDRRAARAGPAAPAGVDVRRRRAGRRDHAEDARDPRQHAAQPDRPRARRAPSCETIADARASSTT